VTALLAAVLVASLVGSLHCVGMCGPFVALYATRPGCGGAADASGWDHAGYHGARLATYALVGLLAGLLGGALDAAGSLAGIQQAAAIAAGVLMVGWGAVTLLRAGGARLGWLKPRAAWLERLTTRALAAGARRSPRWRALAIGALTPLLPCGWLWLFAAAAAGTGGPLAGTAVMGTFWLGTVPALLGVGVGLRALAGRLRRAIPVVSGVVLVAVGAATLASRGPLALTPPAPARSLEEAVQRAEAAPAEEPPCCATAGEEPGDVRGEP